MTGTLCACLIERLGQTAFYYHLTMVFGQSTVPKVFDNKLLKRISLFLFSFFWNRQLDSTLLSCLLCTTLKSIQLLNAWARVNLMAFNIGFIDFQTTNHILNLLQNGNFPGYEHFSFASLYRNKIAVCLTGILEKDLYAQMKTASMALYVCLCLTYDMYSCTIYHHQFQK